MLSCFSLLVKNVITHYPCVVCVWILWWSWALCSWKQMTRWIALRNHVLKDVGTQNSDRMWHWDISFYINYIIFWTTFFWAEMILLFIWTSSIMMLEKWMWAFYPFEIFLFECVLKTFRQNCTFSSPVYLQFWIWSPDNLVHKFGLPVL